MLDELLENFVGGVVGLLDDDAGFFGALLTQMLLTLFGQRVGDVHRRFALVAMLADHTDSPTPF